MLSGCIPKYISTASYLWVTQMFTWVQTVPLTVWIGRGWWNERVYLRATSRFPSENLCVFLISPVHFSCPICPTVFQFTSHQHSLTSKNHVAPHCAILFVLLLLPLSSERVSPSAADSMYYFRVFSLEHKHKHTQSNTINSVKQVLFIHIPDLPYEICVICLNSCIRYALFKIKNILAPELILNFSKPCV